MIYIIIFLLLLCIFSIYYCLKFAIMLIELRDAIEDSLDIIDDKYNNISKILEIPIFYDSYEVKAALNNLEDARNALLHVANKLSKKNIEENVDYYEKVE